MDEETIVLPSARAIRHAQLHTDSDTLFLPNYLTMHEFISKLAFVPEFSSLDEDTRTLLLLEAADFKNFEKLQIERNFFTFVKNSSYIFKFFEELAVEMTDVASLLDADMYGEYEEHITILTELYKRYEAICCERKLLDPIFLPKLYTFNKAFAKSHKCVRIDVAGYLTNFELKLLEEATHYCEVILEFTSSAFNTKMQEKLQDLGFEIEGAYRYELSLNEKKILSKEPYKSAGKVSCEAFSEELLEVAFVKQKIYEFIQKGYEAQKIAVVLPNESAAVMLKLFDTKSNLNFAMGESYKESEIYKTIMATLEFLDDKTAQNSARFERVGDGLYTLLSDKYHKPLREVEFLTLMQELRAHFTQKRELEIFDEELFRFEKVLGFMQEMKLRSVLSLFMQRLGSRSFDDVRGGKVTVMGVLETRSIPFDAVILIDFDENNVPKRSNKDMFLNTALRERAALPTMKDRENLQKHYYSMLFANAKEVAIAYVASEQNRESRFLKELGIKKEERHSELDYAKILFEKQKAAPFKEPEIIIPYTFADVKLSASRLKTFLECKRRYYYHYILHLDAHEVPQDIPAEYAIGQDVHRALDLLYSKQRSFHDYKELESQLYKQLDYVCGESELERYLIAIQKKQLKAFCHNEIERFRDGWEVAYQEEPLTRSFKGIELVGRIDRIDRRDGVLEVLDYKTGSYKLYTAKNYEDATDFQMEFYYLLAEQLGDVKRCGFYNLKEGIIEEESFLFEKLERLEAHIDELLSLREVNFEKCEDTKNCNYCPYAVMCGRG